MIQLLLLRHAKAVRTDAAGDKSRALDKRGRASAVLMGAWLRDERLRPDVALISDARRTRETFELASAQFGEPIPPRFEPGMYDASEDALLRILHRVEQKAGVVLMVGHNPGIADLALRLTGAGDGAAITHMRLKFPTAAIACLSFETGSWSDIRWSAARLERFVTPASLTGAAELD